MPQTNAAAHPVGGYAGLVSVALCPVVNLELFAAGRNIRQLRLRERLHPSNLTEAGTSCDAPGYIGFAVVNPRVRELAAEHISLIGVIAGAGIRGDQGGEAVVAVPATSACNI